jgi:hypothetical protein
LVQVHHGRPPADRYRHAGFLGRATDRIEMSNNISGILRDLSSFGIRQTFPVASEHAADVLITRKCRHTFLQRFIVLTVAVRARERGDSGIATDLAPYLLFGRRSFGNGPVGHE